MRHGESQLPEDRPITVHLTVNNARLAAVEITGDFQAVPTSALDSTRAAIIAGLNGAPADASLPALAARVRAAIPFGVELIGASAESIALAVQRAVSNLSPSGSRSIANRIGAFTSTEIARLTAEWKELPWRILEEVPQSPAWNVAYDEVLTERIAVGVSPPTLRFWGWNAPAVIIGRCQSVTNEVDRIAATEMGVEIVRRMTGGGAMFVEPGRTITYSLCLPESAIEGLNIRQSYEVCDAWVVQGLRELGIDAHHIPVNDIACKDGKIGGAAQARRKGVVLHHTTMAYDMDPAQMAKVLRIGREKLRDRAVSSAAKRVAPLKLQTLLSRDAIVAHLSESFRMRYGGSVAPVTAEEDSAVAALVIAKYAHPAWTEEYE